MDAGSIFGFAIFVVMVVFIWRSLSKDTSKKRTAIEIIFEQLEGLESSQINWTYSFGYFPDEPFIQGCIKGREFKIKLYYKAEEAGDIEGYSIGIRGQFPKRTVKERVFDFLGLVDMDHGVSFRGNRIYKKVPLDSAANVLDCLDELVVLAVRLEKFDS